MINNFFNTVNQDLVTLKDYLINIKTAKLDDKVKLAALRIFTVLGMALAISTAFGALVAAKSLAGSVLTIALSTAFYCLNHDIFIIARNYEKPVAHQVFTFGKKLFNDFKDILNGKKQINKQMISHPHADGTIFRTLMWDKILWKMSLNSSNPFNSLKLT